MNGVAISNAIQSGHSDLQHEPTGGPPRGPALGPNMRPADFDDLAPQISTGTSSAHSANRATVRSLTLPQYPNLDIPPSPPGSPPPGLEAKISHFLRLKKQGVHFNSKLASASSLKNPSLLPKMMVSAGLTDEHAQYKTSLCPELWNPDGFPNHAFTDELDKSQREVSKKKDAERMGKAREFRHVSQAC